MSLRSKAGVGLALTFLAASAVAFPRVAAADLDPVVQRSFAGVSGVALSPSGIYVYAIGVDKFVGNHGLLVVYKRHNDGSWELRNSFSLPTKEPASISVDNDGDVHIVDAAGRRELIYRPPYNARAAEDPKKVNPLPGQPPIDEGFGFSNQLLVGFDESTNRFTVRSGTAFGALVPYPVDMPDLPHFDGVDQYPDAKPSYEVRSRPRASTARSRKIRSMFVVLDANNNRLVGISDAATPRFVSSAPGPPGGERSRYVVNLAVSPLNYNRSFYGAGNHPIVVPVAALRNVFVLRDGTWQALSSTPFGAVPQHVAASCTSVVVTDGAAGKVTFFNFRQPKGTVCEELVNVALSGKRVSSPTVLVKPYGNFTARVSLAFRGKGKTKARKARLKAGRIKTVKLKFSRRATRRIARALGRHHSIKGTLTLRLKNKAGEKFTVKRRIRIRRG